MTVSRVVRSFAMSPGRFAAGHDRAPGRAGPSNWLRARIPAIGLAGFLGIACAEDTASSGAASDATTVRDSAGIEIVTSTRPADATEWRLETAPAFVIRTNRSQADPEFILFDVGDVVQLSDGRVVIENRGTSELLVFDARGGYLETWGRRGAGPGEFQDLVRLFECGGNTLFVQEDRRATLLDAAGDVVGVSLRRRDLSLSSRVVVHGAAADCGSTLWGTFSDPRLYVRTCESRMPDIPLV